MPAMAAAPRRSLRTRRARKILLFLFSKKNLNLSHYSRRPAITKIFFFFISKLAAFRGVIKSYALCIS